jgi:hypothetical protein
MIFIGNKYKKQESSKKDSDTLATNLLLCYVIILGSI